MSATSEFISAVRTVNSHVKEVNDVVESYYVRDYTEEMSEIDDLSQLETKIVEPEEIPEDASNPLVLMNCHRHSKYYGVIARPGLNYFAMRYSYDFVASLAAQIQDDRDPEKFLQAREIEMKSDNPEEIARQATIELLTDFGESNLEELEYQLMDRLLQEDVYAEIIWETFDHTDNEIIEGFDIVTRVFPYESTFSPSEFDSRVQKIVTLGRRGSNFINYSFNLDEVADQADINWVSGAEDEMDIIS